MLHRGYRQREREPGHLPPAADRGRDHPRQAGGFRVQGPVPLHTGGRQASHDQLRGPGGGHQTAPGRHLQVGTESE